jgi:integrase
VQIDVPRDRTSEFELQLVRKGQTRFDGLDEDIISLYARGRLKNDLLGEKTKRKALRKGTTVNRYLQLLSKIFEMAFEEGLIELNPMRRVPLEPEGEGRERYLTHEEEKRLLPVLTGRLTHLRAPVILAIDTGMRKISELLRLRVEHCNFGGAPVFFNING